MVNANQSNECTFRCDFTTSKGIQTNILLYNGLVVIHENAWEVSTLSTDREPSYLSGKSAMQSVLMILTNLTSGLRSATSSRTFNMILQSRIVHNEGNHVSEGHLSKGYESLYNKQTTKLLLLARVTWSMNSLLVMLIMYPNLFFSPIAFNSESFFSL